MWRERGRGGSGRWRGSGSCSPVSSGSITIREIILTCASPLRAPGALETTGSWTYLPAPISKEEEEFNDTIEGPRALRLSQGVSLQASSPLSSINHSTAELLRVRPRITKPDQQCRLALVTCAQRNTFTHQYARNPGNWIVVRYRRCCHNKGIRQIKINQHAFACRQPTQSRVRRTDSKTSHP